MALKNTRIGTDQRFALSLSNAGAKINMNDVEVLHLCMYSNDQRSNDGSISYAVNADDATVLDLLWPAKSQSYLGEHSVHGTIRYAGAVASFDIPAVNVVSKTSEADISTDTIVLEAPVGTEDLSATITIQGMGPQGPQGPKGQQGPKGDKMTYADLTQEDKKDLYEGASEVMKPLLATKQNTLTDTDGGYGQRVAELETGKANLKHKHTVADITDFPELYYDATAFFTSGAYPSDKYGELLEAVKAKKTVYATIDEEGYVSNVFFMSTANSDNSSSRVLLTTIFADGGNLYMNTFVLQQSGMTPLQESITGKADKATTLAGYGIADAYTKSELDALLNGKQDTLTAGNGISIEGNVISASVAEVVDKIVNAGYVFAGVATPTTDPGTPEAKVFYIANGKGTYTNFGGLEVTEDEVVVLYYDTAWHKVSTGIASQEKLSELGKKVIAQDISFEAGAVNYLNGNLISDAKAIRTDSIPISEDVRIIGSFPRSLSRGYIVKYLNGVYAGYEDISVSGTNINQLLQKDAMFNSFRLRVDVARADWTAQEISGSSAKIYLQDSVAEKLYTLSDSVENIEGKITASPSSLENILTMQGVLQLLQRMKKTYFAYSSKGFANLSGLSVGSTFVFSPKSETKYTYDYISVEEGDVIILTTMGTTPSAKSYAIMDADNKVLAIQQNAVTNALLIMPTGAKSFVANTKTSTSGYSFVHIMGKTADYDSAVEIIESLVRKKYTFLPVGKQMSLENGPMPAGSTIMEVTGSDAVTSINLYDANGENQTTVPIASLPYTTTMDFYKASTYIDGTPLLTIVTRGIEDILGDLQKPIDPIMAKEYEIANHDNDFSFDNLFVGQLVSSLLQMQRNFEVPCEGAYLSTDVENVTRLSEPVTDEQMLKANVPYLYIDGIKRGTIVLFDADGTPFIYDKNGTKKYLTLS